MGKRVFMAIITIAFVSLIVGMQAFGVAKANPFWGVYPVAPNNDKPILIVESPGNYSACTEGIVTLNFTVVKPSSWNMTVAPFGTCANGRIDSVNVSLNGVEKFQEFLWSDNLNGGGSWNKSYSVNVEGLNSGINALEIAVSANSLSFNANSTNNTLSLYPLNVESILYLNFSKASLTPTVSILSPVNDSFFNVSLGGTHFQLIYETNTELSWVGYSINGYNNVTVTENGTWVHEYWRNGYNILTLYANDTSGNWAIPQSVTYLVNFYPDYTPTPSPSNSPTQQSTLEASQTPDRLKIGDFAPVIIPASIIFLAIVVVGLLVYFRKRRG